MLPLITDLFNLRWNLYLTDFMDIVIITLLIYSFFIFILKTRSYMVFFGLAIAAGLYVVAETFNLYLTFLALRYFVGVSILLFVIIFQTEIRKYFEFLGLMGTRQIKVGKFASRSPSTAEMIQACVRMAQTKTGALIVIQGKDSLESFVEGGTDLDGVISEDVLLSIFDPHSAGHDGAVIITNNRIAKFGAHLPLSTNFREIGKHGTRHSAALGLSENSDALCIVVSEEKGKISVARDGRLKALAQFTDLERHLTRFIREKYGDDSSNNLSGFFRHNLGLKIGAIVFSVLVWFFSAYQAGIVQKSYDIPVTLNQIPESTIVQSYSPKEIRIHVSGRGEASFTNIEADDFKVNIDAADIQNGVSEKIILKRNIVVPGNLSLIEFEPTKILLTATKYNATSVSVKPNITGQPADGLEMTQTLITPDTVEVWVPEGMEAPQEIMTETIDVTNITESSIIPVKLVVPEDLRLISGQGAVNVAITVESTK